MKKLRLFVYGSLRRGHTHHAELGGARWLGTAATAPRYAVLEWRGYPALVSGKQSVQGELFEVDRDRLARLDEFEGPDYRRRLIRLQDGTRAQAYVLASKRLPS